MNWPAVNLLDALASAEVFVDGDWVESKDQDPDGDVRLIQLADVGDGEYIDKSDRFLTSTKARELRCTFLKPGDVLVARMPDPLGRACIFPGDPKPSITVVDVCIIRPDPHKHDARWLMHSLNAPECRHQIAGYATGTTRSRISRGNLGKIKLPLPPLLEQRRIAAILDKADALRAKRRAALAQLDTLTQSIFLDMFGDPATNPKGWPVRRLDSICGLVNGRAFKPEEWEEKGVPIIRIQNLNDASKPFNYTTQAIPERFRVRPGDILFSWSGTPGTSFGCFRWSGPVGWLNQHIFNVKLNGSINGDFFIAHLNLKLVELIAKAHGGVGLQHVTKGMVDETILMVPADALQAEFARRVVAVTSQMDRHRVAQAEMDSLVVALQHRAFRGEL